MPETTAVWQRIKDSAAGDVKAQASDGKTMVEEKGAPSVWLVHAALILCQCIFGGGSVVGKLGVSKFNPMVFALIREISAGILLFGYALYVDGRRTMPMKDVLIFVGCGFFIFVNQACFIVGDKLAGATLASAWQPTQPIMTLVISLCLGWEMATIGKVAGILVSVGGAAFMVTYGADFSGGTTITGNLLLFSNCLGTALYVIVAKVALARGYPPTTVTAWSYLAGACMMACVAVGFSSNCDLVNFVCPEDDKTTKFTCDAHTTSCEPWKVPTNAILPLCYWVLFNSCGAYLLMTWANHHAKAGFVLAYCALQPLVSMTLSAIIVSAAGEGHMDLKMPGLNALGSIPILIGLFLILWDGKRQHDVDAADTTQAQSPLLNGERSELHDNFTEGDMHNGS